MLDPAAGMLLIDSCRDIVCRHTSSSNPRETRALHEKSFELNHGIILTAYSRHHAKAIFHHNP
jgi:hypothetical protein